MVLWTFLCHNCYVIPETIQETNHQQVMAWENVPKTMEPTKACGASVLKDYVFVNFHGSF